MITIGHGMTVLLGGARSGKSDLAVRLASRWDREVVFVATATAEDADMEARIERHRQDRPDGWTLVEEPLFGMTHAATLAPEALVVVDCVTLLVANLVFTVPDDAAIVGHVDALGEALANRSAPTLVVSNEVGLGVHPETDLGMRYRDVLGRANRRLAERAEASVFVVAGRGVRMEEIEAPW